MENLPAFLQNPGGILLTIGLAAVVLFVIYLFIQAASGVVKALLSLLLTVAIAVGVLIALNKIDPSFASPAAAWVAIKGAVSDLWNGLAGGISPDIDLGGLFSGWLDSLRDWIAGWLAGAG